MSSRKERKGKKRKQPLRKAQKKRPSEKKQRSSAKLAFMSKPWVAGVVFGIAYIWMITRFFVNFGAHPTRNSKLINIHSTFSETGEILIFSILIIVFGYFAARILRVYKLPRRWDIVAGVVAFGALTALYAMAFTEELSPNGDNAEYLMNTKSLVEEGSIYRLNSRADTRNTLASRGLPIILAPIYKIWGFDLVKMKMLIMGMGLALFPLLVLLFQNYISLSKSILISMVVVLSPHLLAAACNIMTEIPYVFWSVLTLLMMQLLAKNGLNQWKYLIVFLVSILMTYLTRPVGLTMVATAMAYMFFSVPWIQYLKKGSIRELWKEDTFRYLVMIVGPLILGLLFWQLWLSNTGVSQAEIFFRGEIFDRFYINLESSLQVFSQMLFRLDTYLWYIFFGNYRVQPLTIWSWPALLCLFAGMITYMRKNNLVFWYTIICWIIILFASLTPAQMVIIRYMSILVPFFIFFLFEGSRMIVKILGKLTGRKLKAGWVNLIPLLVMAQLMFTSFSSDRAVITLNTAGAGPNYDDYVEVARWSNQNLPEDAYVACVKPRIFWFYSQKDTRRSTTISEFHSADYEKEKLELWKSQGVTHLVVDRISGASRQSILPIIQNNPDLFQTLFIAPTSGTTTIYKINFE